MLRRVFQSHTNNCHWQTFWSEKTKKISSANCEINGFLTKKKEKNSSQSKVLGEMKSKIKKKRRKNTTICSVASNTHVVPSTSRLKIDAGHAGSARVYRAFHGFLFWTSTNTLCFVLINQNVPMNMFITAFWFIIKKKTLAVVQNRNS